MVDLVQLRQSRKLEDVCYDIRGPVLEEAKRLEEEGRRIVKLNIGNPAPFGFEAPEEILVDVDAQPRHRHRATAIRRGCSRRASRSSSTTSSSGRRRRRTSDDVWLGNGVSELITMSLQAMLDDGDEVLIPAPDYPLWTAVDEPGRWAGRCTTSATRSHGWLPDLDSLAIAESPHAVRRSSSSTPTTRRVPCTRRRVLEEIAVARPRARPCRPRRRDLRQDPLRRHRPRHRSLWSRPTCSRSPSTGCRRPTE